MGRGITKKQVLGEFRTNEIVAAAKQVIAARGFAAATMDEIAEAAQIAKGTIYLYFKGKDQLFQAVAADVLARLIGRINKIQQDDVPPAEKVRRVLRAMLEHLDEEQALFRVYVSEFPCLLRPSDAAGKSVMDLDREFNDVLSKVVSEALESGELVSAPARRVAHALRGIARGLAIGKLVEGNAEPLVNNLEWLEPLIITGLRRGAAAGGGT